jgi:hypothetical protein
MLNGIEAKNRLEDESLKLAKTYEGEIKKIAGTIQKRLNKVERDLRNKVKLVMDKKNNTLKQSQMNTTLKTSNGISDDPLAASKRNNDKLKARVANLEKSYEMMKTKWKTFEDQLEKERTDRNKYQEEFYKMKSKKTILEKENKDLKDRLTQLEFQLGHAANQISILENTASKKLVRHREESPERDLQVQDLEESVDFEPMINIIPNTNKITQSIQQYKKSTQEKKTPKKQKVVKNKTVEIVYSKGSTEETRLFVELNSLLFATMKMTLPVIMESWGNDNEMSFITATPYRAMDQSLNDTDNLIQWSPRNLEKEYSIADFDENEKVAKELNFGEILYPAFNRLAPLLIESLIISRYICDSHKTIGNLLSLTWNTISFPFITKILPNLTASTLERPLTSLEKSKSYSPQQLPFNCFTSTLKKRLKEDHQGNNTSRHPPLYSLFKDQSVSEVIASSLIDTFFSNKESSKEKENVSSNLGSKNTLRESSRGRSVGKNIQEEGVKRKDRVTDEVKVVAAAVVNWLSADVKKIVKWLHEVEKIVVKSTSLPPTSSDPSLPPSLFLSTHQIPLLTLNLLHPSLAPTSVCILIDLITKSTFGGEVIDLLLQPTLFFVLKQACMSNRHNEEVFNELTMVVYRVALRDGVRVRKLGGENLVEFFNDWLEKGGIDDLAFGNISHILKNIA